MRKLLLILTMLTSLGLASQAGAATITVAINRAGFTPNPARIETGDTVTWTNSDTRNRQVISKGAGFASPILKPGETYSFTFKNAGRFAYEETLVEPTQKGSVVVTTTAPPPPPPAAPGTATLSASRTSVVYGASVALTGELSSSTAGESVEVLAAPAGNLVAMTKIMDTTTTAGGEFRVNVRPTVGTRYRVRWKNSMSGGVTVGVRPRLGLGISSVSRGMFRAKATSARNNAGRTVLFQRAGRFGQWVTLKRVRLGAFGSAGFHASLPRGVSRVRLYMTAAQAGGGYMAGTSAIRLVRR
jgi:plastocyanin